MLTGELRSQIDSIWNSFWSGGISNPLEVMEQLTYLLFLKRLDDLQTLEENKANRLGESVERTIFPAGHDDRGRPYADYRWSRFKNMAPAEMFTVVGEHIFPFLRTLGGEGSTYATHMRDARFTIPTPGLLQKAVDGLDGVPMIDRDTKGDVYEYMLSKIATAGQNGQFRTPRHIIGLMVEMTAPTPTDIICDPACGTCGYLVAAGEYIRNNHPEALRDKKLNRHFHEEMFNGFDFDNTMLRIGSMNMLLHGVERPDIRYKDSLAEEHGAEIEAYPLILANPPLAGSLDYENVAKDLLQVVKAKKTELLFLALFLRLLKPGGRAAVIVPDGVLFGSTKAHKELRRILIEDQKLDGIVKLPSGVFKPYAGVSTAIVLFTKTNSGGTDHVWFYDLQADGRSLDDKRTELLPPAKLGATPAAPLTVEEHAKNNLPDALVRWQERDGTELDRARTEQSFCVPRADIVAERLRPQHQPLQGDRPRRGRLSRAEGDPQGPRRLGGRNPPGNRRPGDDAVKAGWQVLPFDEVFEDVSAGQPKTKTRDFLPSGRFPLVDQGQDVIGGYTDNEGQLANVPLPVIVFGDHTRALKYVDFRFGVGADGVKLLRPRRDDEARYLFRFLQAERIPAMGCDRHFKYLRRLKIDLPPVEEQRRIAALLDREAELRAKHRDSFALVDSLNEAIFLDMFGDLAVNNRGYPTGPLGDIALKFSDGPFGSNL